MFRFSIRDLLWLMVVGGLVIGWWQAEHRRADQAFRLKHLRENFKYVTDIGKDFLVMIIDGNAEQGKVEVNIVVGPERRPVNSAGAKDTAAK